MDRVDPLSLGAGVVGVDGMELGVVGVAGVLGSRWEGSDLSGVANAGDIGKGSLPRGIGLANSFSFSDSGLGFSKISVSVLTPRACLNSGTNVARSASPVGGRLFAFWKAATASFVTGLYSK